MRDTEQHNAETAKRASPSCECPCERCRELGCGVDHPIPCVSIDPHRRSGEPCITGTRIPVAIVASLVNDGVPPRKLKRWYPGVTADIARQATTWHNAQGDQA